MARRLVCQLLACVCALAFAGLAGAAGGGAAVSLTLPAHPALGKPVAIVVHPHRALPKGGFYYVVLVLHEYPGTTQPGCAISSNMQATQYGFAAALKAVRLRLTPAPGGGAGWCPGGKYLGAVYADPRRPPCSSAYPCSGHKSSEYGSPCWELEGHPVCGVVVRPTYSYPGGLPKPITKRTYIAARFTIDFPAVSAQP